MSEELIAGGALVLVALVGLIGTVIQSRKTRQQNTDQHAEGRAAIADVLDHIIHLHGKVDHVGDRVDEVAVKVVANGERTAAVEAQVEKVATDLHTHMTQVGDEQRQEAGFMEARLSSVPLNEGA